MYTLGISCFYHDAAAALLRDGVIVAAVEEERFTRKKHDHGFPKHSIGYCLLEAGITMGMVDQIIFHEKPFVKFERIIQTFLGTWPLSIRPFLRAIPQWLNQKLWVSEVIKKETGYKGEVYFSEHHLSHAASCYLLSPFEGASILTIDGVGEWTTTMKGFGSGTDIEMTHEMHFPHSLGLLYSTFTAYLGFEVNEGEYKVMGMAPYGEPKYVDRVMKILDIRDDGSFHMDMSYFAFHRSFQSFSGKFERLFGPARRPESNFDLNDPESQRYADIAASIQYVLEDIVLKMARKLHAEAVDKYGIASPQARYLTMAGGVALNCTANGRLLREGPYENLFVFPAAGDSGGALGAAAYLYNTVLKKTPRVQFNSVYTGPEYNESEIEEFLKKINVRYSRFDDESLINHIAEHLANDKVIGWHQGRMELGPRALGNRSILASPKKAEMKDIINAKIKHRELFRPFAPVTLVERVTDYFNVTPQTPHDTTSYMLLTAPAHENKRNEIPAVTHEDGSARVQALHREHNPRYYDLIKRFGELTGTPVLVNTSFNVRGEPIVNTPEQAYNCFARTDIDVLVIGPFVVVK